MESYMFFIVSFCTQECIQMSLFSVVDFLKGRDWKYSPTSSYSHDFIVYILTNPKIIEIVSCTFL